MNAKKIWKVKFSNKPLLLQMAIRNTLSFQLFHFPFYILLIHSLGKRIVFVKIFEVQLVSYWSPLLDIRFGAY